MDSTDISNEKYNTTPLKGDDSNSNAYRRQIRDFTLSNQYKTPVRCNESIINREKVPSSFKIMPIYSPPASAVPRVKNPFEHPRFLKERLSQPICSPSLFEKKTSSEKNDQFSWSIEEISILRPAPINENPVQEFDSWFSPATESEAQKAINKFFASQVVNMESPISNVQDVSDVSDKSEIDAADAWSQTILTFPPNLPVEVERILSIYCTFNGDSSNGDEDLSCSVSRKKLSFECVTDDESLCGTPLQIQNKCSRPNVASTPVARVFSSPELSPIVSNAQDSPMDISVSYRPKTRLSIQNDVHSNSKENVQLMSWKYQSGNGTLGSDKSPDSAISSI